MNYSKFVKTWHTPDASRTVPLDGAGRPKLVLWSVNTRDRVELVAASPSGGFSGQDLDGASFVMREPSTGNRHPIEPRLLDLLYRVQNHFSAQEIRVVSGYRTPKRRASNHGKGRAVDFVVPGATDGDVAKFARELGFVGVGIYPSSGFVHVDVRDRSYFWIDTSGPGRRNRERGILADLAHRSDGDAARRGEVRIGPFVIATDVDNAMRARGLSSGAAPQSEFEDDDADFDAGE